MKGVEGLVAEMSAMRREIEALRRRVAEVEAENAALRKALEEARRAGKGQAAPFSRGRRKQTPKKPGRKAGTAYGSQARREPPKEIDNSAEQAIRPAVINRKTSAGNPPLSAPVPKPSS